MNAGGAHDVVSDVGKKKKIKIHVYAFNERVKKLSFLTLIRSREQLFV
jgi:hypothetical protein